MVNPDHSSINKAPGYRSEENIKKIHRPSKDFRKILGKERDGDRDSSKKQKGVEGEEFSKTEESAKNAAIAKEQEKVAPKQPKLSPFDLPTQAAHAQALPEQTTTPITTPFELLSKPKPEFASEQPDIAQVNPLVGETFQSPIAPAKATTESTPLSPHIQKLVDQIIEKLIYTVKIEGKTETTLTLKHPPMLQGATVIVSTFESAPKEMNITFGNLTQAGQQLLDMQQNKEALKLALEEKGYLVHNVFTTPLKEGPTPLTERSTYLAREDQGNKGEQHEREQEEEQQG